MAIAGRVKAGKSTLLNALVGERLAPTDAGECTRIVTWYRKGPSYAVSAQLLDGSEQTLAFKRGDGALDIRSVDTTNVRFGAGELFVTSGTGGLYVPGIPVARVARAGMDTVLAHPLAQPDRLDFAIVSRVFVPLPPARPAQAVTPQP